MKLFLVDINESALGTAVQEVQAIDGHGEIASMKVDVSNFDQIMEMKEKVLDLYGEVRNEGRRCFLPHNSS
jgi:hypothetical protein